VRIRALSVFEGVVYHCFAVDTAHPERPVLEVSARTQPGDLDAGPLLVTLADYAAMLPPEVAAATIPELDRRGRIVRWMDVPHVRFPTWVDLDVEVDAQG
jgi:hypothetical protein